MSPPRNRSTFIKEIPYEVIKEVEVVREVKVSSLLEGRCKATWKNPPLLLLYSRYQS